MKFKLIIAVLTAAFVFSGCSENKEAGEKAEAQTEEDTAEAEETSETIFAMDTAMTLTAYGPNGEKAVAEAVEEISKLDSLFSVTDENSDIYRLNSEKTAQVSEDTYNVIKEALNYSEKTEGILNIAVYPAVKAWGFTTGSYRIPTQAELDSIKEHIDLSKISLDDETMTVTINDPEGEIDLGSVAKGYASSEIYKIFQENGVESGILSLGGNVQTIGRKTDGSQWRVAVLNPENQSEYSGIISTDSRAVVTSGNYQRYFEENGRLYHHIIDPETCAPAESGLSSVTIVSENGTAADAYSTALFIMGAEKAADFWRKNKDEFEAVLITGEGKIYITEGLEASFTPTDKDAQTEIIRAE
ncbi:MAG: FAD:protein FMN transferase [Clostridiales bacterium]|nr:FAD:protein FMN transferase [Clostridiales bacterium]